MSARPQNPRRPLTRSHEPGSGPAPTSPPDPSSARSDNPHASVPPDPQPGDEEIPDDFEEAAQPHEEDGVMEDGVTSPGLEEVMEEDLALMENLFKK